MDTTGEPVRRIYCGSTYWVRPWTDSSRELWKVTGDGTWLWGPGTYERALEILNEVAPKDEEESE